jgi:hypothetical protein
MGSSDEDMKSGKTKKKPLPLRWDGFFDRRFKN